MWEVRSEPLVMDQQSREKQKIKNILKKVLTPHISCDIVNKLSRETTTSNTANAL